MEVILLKSVEKLGEEGAVVRVKSGYARNYLIPSGLAASATGQNRLVIEETQRQRAKKEDRLKIEATALKAKLEARQFSFPLTVGEENKSFGAVTSNDIAQALAREGFAVEKRNVQLEAPIKALGNYSVSIRIHPEVTASVSVSVVKG